MITKTRRNNKKFFFLRKLTALLLPYFLVSGYNSFLLKGRNSFSPRVARRTTSNTPSSFSSPFPSHIHKDEVGVVVLSAKDHRQNDPKEISQLQMVVTALGSTTSIAVSGTFFFFLAWKRDALMASFFIGSIANGILSKVLKRLLNQSRPESSVDAGTIKPSDGGMPSSHAMSLGFIGTFTALQLPFLWIRLPLVLYALISLYYRINVKLHTWQQILVGSVLGSFNGAVWWHACHGGGNLIELMASSSSLFDPNTGQFPWPLLAIPAAVGAAVVGSVERRISAWLVGRKKAE